MPTETDPRSDNDIPGQFTLGKAYLHKGKMYCECNRPARCRTTRKKGVNHGRKFWSCDSSDGECEFFVWVDREAAAREILNAQAPQGPQTPTKNGVNEPGASNTPSSRPQRSLPRVRETPFTKAKRKASLRDFPVPDDDADHIAGDGGAGNAGTVTEDPFKYPDLPSVHERKAAKTSIIATPSQKFAERLKAASESLPTPQTRESRNSVNNEALNALMGERDTSPTPTRVNGGTALLPRGEVDLTTTVLDLIRDDIPKLKVSTEMQIRHEIGLALDLEKAKLRRNEGTILELHKRIDELETMILNLT